VMHRHVILLLLPKRSFVVPSPSDAVARLACSTLMCQLRWFVLLRRSQEETALIDFPNDLFRKLCAGNVNRQEWNERLASGLRDIDDFAERGARFGLTTKR
jgi:hypothetical protein